jgi:hypothetical protein
LLQALQVELNKRRIEVEADIQKGENLLASESEDVPDFVDGTVKKLSFELNSLVALADQRRDALKVCQRF